MKTIKKFGDFEDNKNEELKHSTYIDAAKKISAHGQKEKAEQLTNHATKISMMGIQYLTFSIAVGGGKKYDAKLDKMTVFKSGDGYIIQSVFKSDDKVLRIDSSVAKNGDLTWKDGNKFGDRKSVSKFQQLVLEISKFQQDFIRFFGDTGLVNGDLNVIPRTYYE